MKKSQKTSLYYMKLCRKALLEIAALEGKGAEVFVRLKRKAEKYLEMAKKLKAEEEKES